MAETIVEFLAGSAERFGERPLSWALQIGIPQR